MPSLTSGLPGGPEEVSVRNVPYIVVKGDKLKNVAVRFMVPLKTLRKINKLSKNFTCYPGMTLYVPVKVRPRGWDPAMESSTDAGMLSQDRLPSVEYEVIGEGFDLDIKDDFMPTSEAQDDSVQFERVGTHIVRIDKRVSVLSYRMDSLKQTEFTFGHDDDLNSVLGRMRMARDQYYINGPLGKEIDSLHRIKATLNNLRIRLRNKITEYEYLRDNEAYAKANYEREEMAKDTHWGDQITYESNYARIKAKHDELVAADTAARPHTDTAAVRPAPVTQSRDTMPTPQHQAMADTSHPAPAPAVSIPATATPAVAESKPATPSPAPVINPATSSAAPKPTSPATATPPANKPATATTTAPKPATASPVATTPKPQPAPSTASTPASSPAVSGTVPRVSFGLLQRVDIAPMVIRHARIDIPQRKRERGALSLLLPEPSQAVAPTTAIATPTATVRKDTTPATASVKPDTVSKPAAIVKADTSHHNIATPVKRDTVRQPLAAVVDTPKNKQAATAKTDTTHTKNPTAVAKDDTMRRPAQAIVTAKDTTKHAPATLAHADSIRKPAAPVPTDSTRSNTSAEQTRDNNKAPAARDTARNFSLTEDNNFDINDADGRNAAPGKQSQSQSTAHTSDTDADIATTGAAGRSGKKPKDQPKKDKKPTDTQDRIVLIDSSKILHEQVYVPFIKQETPEVYVRPGPFFTLDTKYDSTMLYREKKINPDPLASYKTDSNFMATDVMLKEIAITEVKNKPKYLIPVDSVSKIKGEFYLIRARQVLEKGDFKEGDKYLRKSLELDPNNASTWMLHADLCLTTGAADKALKEYAISGEIDSTNPKVFYNIALLYSKANDNQKAYKYFSRATDVNDKYLLAYMGRATVLMDERDYEGAIQDYDKTLSINRYYSPAYKGRALAKMEAHKFEDAIVDFNQYLEIEDPDGYILYQRGIAKILSNNLLQGCLDLSSSLELGFKEADRAIKKFCQ